jgi:DNA-binding MarR family transcriptional regulator
MQERTINNALTRLKQAGYIKKTDTDWLFARVQAGEICTDSTEMLSAHQLPAKSLGYYVRLYHLRDAHLTNEDTRTLSVFENLLSKSKTRYLSAPFIAQTLQRGETRTSKAIKSLLDKGYLKRSRESNNSVYHYTLTSKGTAMNLSTGQEAQKTNPPQNHTPNPPQNRGSISTSDYINNLNQDSGITTNEPQALRRDSFLQKEIQDVVLPYTTHLASKLPRLESEIEAKLAAKNKEYTQFLKDSIRGNPIEISKKISEVSAALAELEVQKKKIEHGLKKWIPYTINENAVLSERLVPLTFEEITHIKNTVKALSPKMATESETKTAYCLLINSVMRDIADRYKQRYQDRDRGVKAKADSINQSLYEIKQANYQLNVAVYPKSHKRLGKAVK